MRKFLLLIIVLFFLIPYCNAVNDTLEITSSKDIYDLFQNTKYLIDKAPKSSFYDISKLKFNEIVKKKHSNTINFGTSQNVYWFKFNLKNNSNIEDWILSIDYPTLNDVRIFIQNSNGDLDTVIYSGINNKINKKTLDDYSIYHSIKVEKNKPYSIYIRIDTKSFIIVPIYISTIQNYLENEKSQNRMVYLLYGLVFSILVLNLLLFIMTREINYFLLVLFLGSLLLNSFYLYGYGIEAFPNLSPYMKTGMRQILFSVAASIFLVFTINYLNLKKFKIIFATFLALIFLCFALVIIVLFKLLPLSVISRIAPLLLLIGTIICFSFGIFSFRRKNKQSYYYLISFSVFLFSSAVYAAVIYNLIPLNFFNLHITLFAGALYGIILTIGLIEKIAAVRTEIEKTKYLQIINKQLSCEIEERKKIETALRESEEKFRLLFNLIPLPVIVSDKEKRTLDDGNFKLFEITGLNKLEHLGQNIKELKFFSEIDQKRFYKSIEENKIITGEEYSFIVSKKEKITCLVYAQLVEIQNEKKLITILSDITQLKRSQQEIKKLSVAMSQSANSIIITNQSGAIEYVNESFVKNTGYSVTEIIGKNPSILKSDYHPSVFYDDLWNTILKGETWSGIIYNRKKNGDLFWEMSTISPIKDDKGKITNFIAIKEDITDKKKQQDKIVESEQQLKELNATKDLFFSIIAHDLMNPLNALLGFSGLLKESINSGNTDNIKLYSEITDQTARRIFELLQNLLIWSKSQSGKLIFNPIFIRIEELLLTFIDLMKNVAANKNITIDYQINIKNKVFLDPNMISTVLRNIISNAIKYSDHGGVITVSFDEEESNYLFTVADNGCGIDPDQLKNLFNLENNRIIKKQTNDISTGLGLMISNDFVLAHKGKLWAESQKGIGSKFYFTIPK